VSAAFLLTSLIIVAMPGTGELITLSAGVSRGARASVVAAFGCTLGIVPHRIAAVTGTAAMLRASPGTSCRFQRTPATACSAADPEHISWR
jgi:threonine/homoserine/homoserine lactone efflux protein